MTAPSLVDYKNFADAAENTKVEAFRGGSIGIWFARRKFKKKLRSGLARARHLGLDVTRATLEKTHAHLGNIEAADPETVLQLLDAELWNPNGEAIDWLDSLGVDHTSISCGDVIDFRGRLLFVDLNSGFSELA